MGFIEEKLNNEETRDFIVPEIDYTSQQRKTVDKVVTLTKIEIEYIFRGMRPRSLDYHDFTNIRKILRAELAQYLKGELIHTSKVSDAMWAEYTKDMKVKPKQKGNTYVKDKELSDRTTVTEQ